MTPIQRTLAVISGENPDRTPVSLWRHFPPDARYGRAAVDAHLDHLREYDLDFLKVMNDNGYPTRPEIKACADLRHLCVLNGDEDGFGLQLDLLSALAAELNDKVLMTTTMFNAWAVLRRLATPKDADTHGPPRLGPPTTDADKRMAELVAEDRTAVANALDAIAASLANFAAKCIDAGADGVFLSVRDDWVNTPENGLDTYDEMVRTGDGQILSAARRGRFNMLHVCGTPLDFDAFAAYPAHVINWADRAAGPAIADVIRDVRPAVAGGVDNLSTLARGRPDDVAAEVRDALQQARDRPIMITPGCTYDPDVVPDDNIHAMVRAARRT
jgi:uroporphyrinogen decarboxylase